MANEWYYTESGARHGPVSTDELKRLAAEGLLAPTELIWKPGMPEWTPASRAKGLFGKDAVPPELPPGADDGPPPVPEVGLAVHAGRRPRNRAEARAARATSGFWASWTDPDRPWSAGWLAALIVATVILPIVGVVAGIVGLTKKSKRAQGGILLAVAIVAFLGWIGLKGSGAAPGSAPTAHVPGAARGIRCPGCRGTGGDRSSGPCPKCASDFISSLALEGRSTGYVGGRPCSLCGGTGYQRPCRSCGGRGVVSR